LLIHPRDLSPANMRLAASKPPRPAQLELVQVQVLVPVPGQVLEQVLVLVPGQVLVRVLVPEPARVLVRVLVLEQVRHNRQQPNHRPVPPP
jgi:hypothetical protein